tara:strand:+ start:25407 stop:26723 length:1317 start_codon:yes stop_codon:yes gene_type:complete
MAVGIEQFKPTRNKSRINSLDVIRGIALLGILLMNINGMGLPFSYSDPSVLGHTEGLNFWVWFTNELLFEGTMRGLFTLLFGAGIILLTKRLESDGAGITTADIYYRRMIWLLLFGLANVWILLWHGDILYPYAIFGLLLFPFRNLPVKNLFVIAALLISIGILWDISDYRDAKNLKQEAEIAMENKMAGVDLSEEEAETIDTWETMETKKTEEEIQQEIEKMNAGYFQVIQNKASLNQMMQTWMPYRYWVWDILSYMFIGMAFFKLKIFQAGRSTKFYLLMAGIGYLAGISINYYETHLIVSSNYDVVEMAKASQTYQLGRFAVTMGHVGLFMVFIMSGILAALQKALAAVGRMALSNYLIHSIITSILFYGFGFGLYGQLERYELYYVVFGIWIFQLVTSPIWLKYFLYGPFEWVWRSLTYGKKQPLLKTGNDSVN